MASCGLMLSINFKFKIQLVKTTSYNSIEVYLSGLPISVDAGPSEYIVDVPDGTTEILVYLFVIGKTQEDPWRGYYRVYTEDEDGNQYSQYMNVAFAEDDYTLNSDNMWLPLYSEKKFYIEIPDTFPLEVTVQEMMTFRFIKDTVEAMQNPSSTFESGVFLIGYNA